MKIGIIGKGNIAGTLARHFARLGHAVSIANSRGPETLARLLGRPVVKAFNNIYAEHLRTLGKPVDSPGRFALPIAGDVARAKAVVRRLIDEIGFDSVDADGLDESWRQQPGTLVYGTGFDAAGVRRALSRASPERSSEWRAITRSAA